MPTKLELQERTAALTAKSAATNASAPAVSEEDAQELAALANLSLDDFRKRCDDIAASENDPNAADAAQPATVAGGGSLLDGTYDEAQNAASFAAALAEWRGEPAIPQKSKVPLGERLLAKQQLVNGR